MQQKFDRSLCRFPYEAFFEPPSDFNSSLQVVGCYCSVGSEFLLIQRHPSLSQGLTWGIPGGKVEKGETLHQAMQRELVEELKLLVPSEALQHFGTIWMRLPHIDYTFHTFHASFATKPSVQPLQREIIDIKWLDIPSARSFDLVTGAHEALDLFSAYKLKSI